MISPDAEVVDCAKIYSFLHEENIFKRVIAKVSQHVDTKINEIGKVEEKNKWLSQ